MGMYKKTFSMLKKPKDIFKFKLLVCVVLCSIVIIVFYIINNIIDNRNFRKYTIVEDLKLINSIEKIIVENDEIKLEGYAFILERSSSDNLISLFIRNIVTGDEIWLDTEQIDRNDVEVYYDDDYNYLNSGFIAYTDKKAIDMDEVYEIIINIDYNDINGNKNQKTRKTVSTNQYLLDGELLAYNPDKYDIPDMNIESDLLREVYMNGRLCLYDKEEGIYLYKYDKRLYWITTNDFKFDKNQETHIVFQLYTTQINKLPKNRVKYKFDNLDFIFEDYEYKEEETGPYRIAIHDIPEEYAITYVKTGVYDKNINKSLWTKSFHFNGLWDR